ncbi:hypothetical protein PM082_023128 [Marasmius tenuissimus]|nr:hypothetical protein PM082_023128 [Marasmius tenuissimus]
MSAGSYVPLVLPSGSNQVSNRGRPTTSALPPASSSSAHYRCYFHIFKQLFTLIGTTMKFTIGILAIVIQIASVHSVVVSPSDATEECGSLGVLNVDLNNLPEGMTANDVRKCADHPLGGKPRQNAQWESLAPMESNLSNRSSIIDARAAQKCEYDAPYGCSGGYCWSTCGVAGSGTWCWTAAGDVPLAEKATIVILSNSSTMSAEPIGTIEEQTSIIGLGRRNNEVRYR